MNLGEGATLVYKKDERIANITIDKEQEGTLLINKKYSVKTKKIKIKPGLH